MKKYLRDSSFLKEIDNLRIREQLVKITVLTFAEKPIEEIQGKVTSGSLNIDGQSAIRRNGSLSIVGDETCNNITNMNTLFSMNKKIKIELGILNTTNKYTEEEYIWFPLGVFVVTDSSISHGTDGITISLSFQDKMCLMDGTCGGTFPAAVTINKQSVISVDNTEEEIDVPVFSIIQELVNHWGGEALANIIINDVPAKIERICKWTGAKGNELYLLKGLVAMDNGESYWQYTPYLDKNKAEENQTKTGQTILEFSEGDIVGYVKTDFIYPGGEDLVAEAGTSVVEQLNTIVSELGGNYEFFYDVHGRFVFQEKRNYLNTTQATTIINALNKDNSYKVNQSLGSAEYVFDTNNLFTSINNNPQYSRIKNDYIVWGARKTEDGDDIPIRYHLAIDTKPQIGNTYNCFIIQDSYGYKKAVFPTMYDTFSQLPKEGKVDQYYGVGEATSLNIEDYDSTHTLYKWSLNSIDKTYSWNKVANARYKTIKTKDWRTELYLSDLQAATANSKAIEKSFYYAELYEEWPKLYDIENGEWLDSTLNHADEIKFWLDFIEPTTSLLDSISVSSIGRRTLMTSADTCKANCIFAPELQNIVYIEAEATDAKEQIASCHLNGEDFVQVSKDIWNKIEIKDSWISCYDTVRNQLYEYSKFNESIGISSIPIYHLEPNIRINLLDSVSDISGDYIITSMSLPLDGSQMSINAMRALNRY